MAADSSLSQPVVVRELAPGLGSEFLEFFDRDAFIDNPDWASCYCMYRYFPGTSKEWQAATAETNRSHIKKLIETRKAHGFLAYLDNKVVGSCNATPRTMFPALQRYPELQADDAENVGSVVCFVVAKPYRGRGIAKQLLNAACQYFKRLNLSYAEAYPTKDSESEADNFPGSLEMHLAAGFKPYREKESA